MENKTPVTTLRDGALKATIWENQGEHGVFYNTSFAKTYEAKDGKLKDGNSFSANELLRLGHLANDAYTVCRNLRAGKAKTASYSEENLPADEADGLAQAASDQFHEPSV